MSYPCLHTEGGLIPADIIDEIAAGEVLDHSPELLQAATGEHYDVCWSLEEHGLILGVLRESRIGPPSVSCGSSDPQPL